MAFDNLITDADAAAMLRHWLSTPRFSLLGQNYGNRIAEWLQEPLMADAVSRANDAVRDLRSDIPLFDTEQVDVWVQVVRPDVRVAVFEIGGRYQARTTGSWAELVSGAAS